MQGKRRIRSFRIRLTKLWNGKPDEILFHAYHYKVDDDYSDLSLNYDVYKTHGGRTIQAEVSQSSQTGY